MVLWFDCLVFALFLIFDVCWFVWGSGFAGLKHSLMMLFVIMFQK